MSGKIRKYDFDLDLAIDEATELLENLQFLDDARPSVPEVNPLLKVSSTNIRQVLLDARRSARLIETALRPRRADFLRHPREVSDQGAIANTQQGA